MLLDVLFLAMMMMAVFNGIRNGLVVALFSTVGWILGLYAAFKFSDFAAEYLRDIVNVSARTLSIISFIAVFVVVIVVINLLGKVVEKAVELTMLGWLNRFGGIFFYVLLYTLIFSVLIYFIEKWKLVSEETISSSKVYEWVKPIAEIIQRPFLH